MSYFDAKIELQATDEELIHSFKDLENYRDVCSLLEVTPKHLHYILYKKKNLYYQFDIPKKNGGTREIYAPCDSLKILQQKLNYIMSLIYKPKYTIHGFVKSRGIVSNAKQHLGKSYILNFDLYDFFPSINFGRVRGILRSYFGLGDHAATIIANICCFNNSLPQGAPTSPILSNIVCFNLDKELQFIAKQHSCIYTRYADDITFSTTKKDFPKSVAFKTDSQIFLGKKILKVIEKNSFKVNENKTRLHNRYQNLSVTGITVNEKLNVPRNYIKRIRAMLRCIETNTPENAQVIFLEKYKFRYRANMEPPNIMNVLHGMINYVGFVRGLDDEIFKKLALRYNLIVGNDKIKVKKDNLALWESYVWVVEVGYKDDDDFYAEEQGTGFFLKNVGFVTNAHVIEKYDGESINAIYLNRSRYSEEQKLASIITIDKDRDIAILYVEGFDIDYGFSYNIHHNLGQEIILLGYPNHGDGNSLYINKGQLVQYRSHYMPNTLNKETGKLGVKQERVTISSRIVTGNSGGPVINLQNEVIGIATKGFKDISPNLKDDSTAESMIVKIKDVLSVLSQMSKLHREN
ncbi:reverse transcriptase domain-containing protein [Bacillus siamensis]|uniref:reverse transcriptase domain-containing protein n=1 Tax=Bacillus siamensis TaxID=659243 RepID=UPI002DB67CF2|nr:reverse transcriptase domain-containing protein [Bacillus siamensis]MEC3655600.1 reverse transcriptase domain-containing protein [Bacillus siamensis]